MSSIEEYTEKNFEDIIELFKFEVNQEVINESG